MLRALCFLECREPGQRSWHDAWSMGIQSSLCLHTQDVGRAQPPGMHLRPQCPHCRAQRVTPGHRRDSTSPPGWQDAPKNPSPSRPLPSMGKRGGGPGLASAVTPPYACTAAVPQTQTDPGSGPPVLAVGTFTPEPVSSSDSGGDADRTHAVRLAAPADTGRSPRGTRCHHGECRRHCGGEPGLPALTEGWLALSATGGGCGDLPPSRRVPNSAAGACPGALVPPCGSSAHGRLRPA